MWQPISSISFLYSFLISLKVRKTKIKVQLLVIKKVKFSLKSAKKGHFALYFTSGNMMLFLDLKNWFKHIVRILNWIHFLLSVKLTIKEFLQNFSEWLKLYLWAWFVLNPSAKNTKWLIIVFIAPYYWSSAWITSYLKRWLPISTRYLK